MATFNTIDELIRILDEDPKLREALRARLLTQELLDLPAAHAAFVTETRAFIAGMEEFRTETQAFIAEMRVFVATTNRRLDSLEARMDRGFNRLNHDIGTLRGNYAENAVRRQAITIAFGVGNANGLNFDETTLKPLDRDALVRKASESGIIANIPQSERVSFYVSDFIAEVQDEAGETHYIVVEASCTCDKRDTDRAIAHAELMTMFTQKRAWPVIAGARLDDEIQHIVESRDVLWFRFEQDEFRADYL